MSMVIAQIRRCRPRTKTRLMSHLLGVLAIRIHGQALDVKATFMAIGTPGDPKELFSYPVGNSLAESLDVHHK